MPADIAAAARAIRQDRYDRSDIHQRGAHEAVCDAKAAERVTALVAELAERKAIPAGDRPREFVRRSRGELPTPLSVPCPYCHVGPGRWCVAQSTGQPMRQGSGYHPGRADAAAAQGSSGGVFAVDVSARRAASRTGRWDRPSPHCVGVGLV
jgi:hypothetical protein